MNEFLLSQGTNASFLIRLISLVICVLFTMPLLLKNSIINNGLRPFRLLFLGLGVVGIVANFQTMLFLFDILVHNLPQKLPNVSLQFLNAVYELIRSCIFYGLFLLSFSEKNLKLHQRIERSEVTRKKLNKDRRADTVKRNK